MKAARAATIRRNGTLVRRAASRPPDSDPIAITELMKPNSSGPTWNTAVAISELVIWKFSPNVPSMNTMNSTSMMSGRLRTYRSPSRTPPARVARGAGWSWDCLLYTSCV